MRLDIQDYLNNFFYKYTINEDFIDIITTFNPMNPNEEDRWDLICRLYYLKEEILNKYSYAQLENYVMEILIDIFKKTDSYHYNLDLISVSFCKLIDGNIQAKLYNLGDMSKIPNY